MIRTTIYPDWVQKYRTRGTTVKKKNNCYYLYKRTSKRVPGKKYPQPVDTYIGVITEDGIVYAEKKLVPVDSESCEVREYGYSKALQLCCPEEFRKSAGKNWKELLLILTEMSSPNTYLGYEFEMPDKNEYRYSYGAQLSALYRKIYSSYKVQKQELEVLKTIYIVYFGKKKFMSRINDEQKAVLRKLGITELGVA